MKTRVIISLYLVFVYSVIAAQQGPALEWAKAMGGPASDQGRSIAIDASGNVVTTGYFTGTSDFDPGAGVFTLTSTAGEDIFISKLDASGNFVWAKQLGGAGNDQGRAITTDASGNVLITGVFSGTVDFDPGTATFNLTSAGSTDVFILKLDASGNFIWAKQLGGTGNDEGNAIAADASGNVVTTGLFSGTGDFDPGAGILNLTSTGGNDIFISKLNASGNLVWVKQSGGTGDDQGRSIAIDATGNALTTGIFSATVDFDPGAGVFSLTTSGGFQMFISKLDALGNFVWAKQMGSLSTGEGIATDALGNVFTTGFFDVTGDFDPGPGVFTLNPSGNYGIFISKLDASGNFVWAKKIEGATYASVHSIATDASSNLLLTGLFDGTLHFSGSSFTLASTGSSYDMFLGKLDASGNFVWATKISGTSYAAGWSIATDAAGNMFVTGAFSGTGDFDPGAGAFTLTSAGTDVFVYKLSQPLAVPTITSFTPVSGPIGTTVIITGTNFSTTPASNIIKFNGTTAAASASTVTTITTTVPAGATTGLITVAVGGETATSAIPFTVTTVTNNKPPVITTQRLATQIGGIITLDLVPHITTSGNNLDIGSIQVTVPPPSGAVAEVNGGILTINYSALSFSGTEQITVIACDLNDNCVTEQFDIEVSGALIVYNAVSPNGANPTLVIQNIEVLDETKKNTITVFDRWQNEVWRGTNYDNSTVVFKGISDRGKELPTGTYFYRIDFITGRKSQTGFISLKR